VLLHCWAGCRQAAVICALTERGLWETERPSRSVAPERPREPWAIARELAQREPWTRPGVLQRYAVADALKMLDRIRADIRDDSDQAWAVLAECARLESALESALGDGSATASRD